MKTATNESLSRREKRFRIREKPPLSIDRRTDKRENNELIWSLYMINSVSEFLFRNYLSKHVRIQKRDNSSEQLIGVRDNPTIWEHFLYSTRAWDIQFLKGDLEA